MNVFWADLHIHTALSPCAADEMTPPAIVQAAQTRGLSMIAICDHNAVGNTAATQIAAGGALTVIAGMEVTTAEEVHVVALFPDVEAARAAADAVTDTLPLATDENRRHFGEQWLLSAAGERVGDETHLLAAATPLSLSQVVTLIQSHGGLAVAAHVNRPSFSVLSQLGVFPTDVGFDALEVFAPPGKPAPTAAYAQHGLPILRSSDSHYLADVGTVRTGLRLEHASFDELRRALRGQGGRRVLDA